MKELSGIGSPLTGVIMLTRSRRSTSTSELDYAMNVASHHVEERIDHLSLQLRSNASDHSEVEERKVSAVHHQ